MTWILTTLFMVLMFLLAFGISWEAIHPDSQLDQRERQKKAFMAVFFAGLGFLMAWSSLHHYLITHPGEHLPAGGVTWIDYRGVDIPVDATLHATAWTFPIIALGVWLLGSLLVLLLGKWKREKE